MENKDNIESNPPPQDKELEFAQAKGIWNNIKIFLNYLIFLGIQIVRRLWSLSRRIFPLRAIMHGSWCSLFLASVGLNVSSTAVVIGAMLISPLMGPIVGVGLSV